MRALRYTRGVCGHDCVLSWSNGVDTQQQCTPDRDGPGVSAVLLPSVVQQEQLRRLPLAHHSFTMALARLMQPFMSWATRRYQTVLAERLKDYGLRYDDLYDPIMDMDIAEALRRLPPEVIVARNQRLKRAMDLSLKHEKLPKELRDKQTPFDHYLLPILEEVRAEKMERARLGSGPGYQRTIP